MKIDPVLGIVSFPGITIGPHLSRQEFLQSSLGAAAKLGVVNAGWITMHIHPEPQVYASLSFKDNQLIVLDVSMLMPSGESDTLDRACELRRKAHHDAWLKSELGNPPYEYLWGTVDSTFDEKGLSSGIIVIIRQVSSRRSLVGKEAARTRDQHAQTDLIPRYHSPP